MPLTNDNPTAARPVSAKRYRSLFRSFAIGLCVAVTMAVVLMVAVEIYSYKRYAPAAGDDLEPAVKLDLAEGGSVSDREYWKEFQQSGKVVYHQYVLWRRAPYNGKLINIDQDGVRRTLHTRCDADTFTIWMFGDSVMWGAGTPDADTIPSLVAQDFEKAGQPVCIVNYGEKGWSNTQEVVGLIELLKHAARKPDAVLFYDGGTEAFTAYQSGRADEHSNFNQFKNFLENWRNTQRPNFLYLRQTNTYRLLEKIAAKQLFHSKQAAPSEKELDTDALSSAVVENYVQNMGIVNLLGRQYGFRPIFAWYPNLAVGHKELTPYERQALLLQYAEFPNLGPMYQAVYNRSGEIKSPDFYNFADIVDDRKSSLYLGISHMRPEGDRIVADRLFNIFEHDSAGHNISGQDISGHSISEHGDRATAGAPGGRVNLNGK